MMDKQALYEKLRSEIKGCSACDLGCELVDDYDPHVVGQGNINADVMFIAEAPGKQETIHGKPLTPPGTSGKVYERVLSKVGLKREGVYTSNVVACRPPNNRDPEPWEVKKCSGFLERQIELVEPKLIVTFGRFASQSLIGKIKITKDHGQLTKIASGRNVFPMFHPSYVHAYAPQWAREAFKKDVQTLKRLVEDL